MELTQAQIDDFAIYARRVETWLAGSRRHLAVYGVLADRLAVLNMTTGRPQDEFSGCHYAAYLHAGLAVESAVKALMISEDPTIVQDGKLDRKKLGKRSGHGFIEFAERFLGELSEEERHILFNLEEHVVWAGKYTVPMQAHVLYDHDALQLLRSSPMNEREIIRGLVSRLQRHANAA
jgi:hypothetical protein